MSSLPTSWVVTEVGETGEYINGMAFKPSDWEDNGRPIIRIQNLTNPNKESNRTSAEIIEKYIVNAGDILVAWSASLGVHIWNGEQAVLNQHIFKVAPTEGLVEKRFLFHGLNRVIIELIQSEHLHGSTMKHINRGPFLAHPFPLPPLAEQKRIVARVDSLTAKTTRTRQAMTQIKTLTTRYKQAILTKAFSGIANHQELGGILEGIKAGKNLRCEERPPDLDEKGVVKVSAVSWGKFDPSQSKTLPADFVPDPDTLIKPRNFLFSRANTIELVGAVVIVKEAPHNLYLSDKVLRLDIPNNAKNWVLWFLRSPEGRKDLESVSSGNQLSMRNVSQKNLKAIRIPFPKKETRDTIVRRIETAFAHIDGLAQKAEAALALTDRLDEAILAKAFTGNLVPQSPNDEPASILLERIKAEREMANKLKKTKPRKPRKTGKMTVKNSLAGLLETWPLGGLSFEEISQQVPGNYDELRDQVFAMLSGSKPQLQQKFDEQQRIMLLKKVAS